MPVKNHVCSTCDLKFSNKYHLQRHMRSVHCKDNRFVCKQCDKAFTRNEYLLFHVASKHNGNDSNFFRCKVCSRLFRDVDTLKSHTVNKHSNKTTESAKCGISSTTKQQRNQHNNEVINSTSLGDEAHNFSSNPNTAHDEPTTIDVEPGPSCAAQSICSSTGSSVRNHSDEKLHTHTSAKLSKGKVKKRDTMRVENCGFICNDCGWKFSYKSHLQRHIRSIHCKDNHFICMQCDKPFSRNEYLLFHVASIHNGNDSNFFRCKVCSRLFRDVHTLKSHTLKEHSNKTTESAKCGISPTTKQQRNQHNGEGINSTSLGDGAHNLSSNPNTAHDEPSTVEAETGPSCAAQKISSSVASAMRNSSDEVLHFHTSAKNMNSKQESTSHVATPSNEVKDEIKVHEDTKDFIWDSLLKVECKDSKEWVTQDLVPFIKDHTFSSNSKTEACAITNNENTTNMTSDNDSEKSQQVFREENNPQLMKNKVNEKVVGVEELENRIPLCSNICEIPEKCDASFDERPINLPLSSPNHVDSIFCKCFCCRLKFRTKKKPMYNGYKYQCTVCSRKFDRSGKLTQHIETKCNQIKLFSCSYCAKGFSSKETLKGHISNCSRRDSKVRSEIKCKICNKTYGSRSALKKHTSTAHINTVELKDPQTCDVCGKVYNSLKSLISHKSKSHSLEKFECGHCGKIFKYKDRLTTHIQEEHMKGYYFYFHCDQCSKRFKDESRLKGHKVQQHSIDAEDKLPFICEFCGKTFPLKAILKRHLNLHSEKSVVCDVCGKCFRSKTNLDQHSWTHSNVRPFVCDVCGKSFKIRNHLCQHLAVHGMVNTSWRGKRKQKNIV